MKSLPDLPQQLIKNKKQIQIYTTKKKQIKFEVLEAFYNDFKNFASNYVLKDQMELKDLVYLGYNQKYYFNSIRQINKILIQSYRAEVNQNNGNCPSLVNIQYFKLSDLLIDLDNFLLLKALTVILFKSSNIKCLSYPLNMLQYLSSQKPNLEQLQLIFSGFTENIIDTKFCEELQKCQQLKSIEIEFCETNIQVQKAYLISKSIQNLPNLSKISIKMPLNKMQQGDRLVSIIKQDTQNNQLKQLKLGQYAKKQGLETFNYDLEIISNAPNLEELEISSYHVKLDENYLKKIIKNSQQKLQKLRKLDFTFKYSEFDQQLQIIKDEAKKFKSLEVLTTAGFFDDETTYFLFEYDKFGVIQKMLLNFQYWRNYGPYVSNPKHVIQENIKRQQLLEKEIQFSENNFRLASLRMQNLTFYQYKINFNEFSYEGTFEKQQLIKMMSSINQKIRKIYFIQLSYVNIFQGTDEEEQHFRESKIYYYIIRKYLYAVKFSDY
ncbi:hypothetical protein TTHERM_00660400 (macronuclear) [Tetrahymena thermophila SB210]|uniref:Uncharacterized protein n=1 Tax=Tetrahymena thermophila (strain SB210) TaxID=312017 RepID=I7MKR0_TETTS|nr:hypothetical protein TTHERM_00660400 [Tetrahymena thermophila SB210]EAR99858.2 hypothetical protein TTHERM_00660400 [Tetrahymena thermophila SB210]|eukprot:XP_001020103.2 hypothetical protein TTHERM_00660400 [Tetrahymena thermophila SB210]